MTYCINVTRFVPRRYLRGLTSVRCINYGHAASIMGMIKRIAGSMASLSDLRCNSARSSDCCNVSLCRNDIWSCLRCCGDGSTEAVCRLIIASSDWLVEDRSVCEIAKKGGTALFCAILSAEVCVSVSKSTNSCVNVPRWPGDVGRGLDFLGAEILDEVAAGCRAVRTR